jgi:hypothetical protein
MKHSHSSPSKAAIVAAALGPIMIAAGAFAVADTVDNLVTFSAGTTARAADVNANFSAVAAAVNGNHAALAEIGLAVNARTTHVPAAADAAANGAALLAAVADIGDIPSGEGPWTVQLQAGRYDLGASQLILPANVHLIGAGMTRTTVEAERAAAGPTADAAVMVGASGTYLQDLQVTNRATVGGAAVALYTDDSIRMVRSELGQNSNSAGASIDSYGLIGTFVTAENSSLIGFAPTGRIGVGVHLSGGGSINRSTLHTQGTDDGAAIIVAAAATSTTTVSGTLIRGFGAGRGFIHDGTGTLTIVFSEFVQSGDDGLVNNGNVRIGASMRGGTISVVGGAVACAQNFTAAMVTLAGC